MGVALTDTDARRWGRGESRISTGRTFFIDRLRVVLSALVILHHTAITCGGQRKLMPSRGA